MQNLQRYFPHRSRIWRGRSGELAQSGQHIFPQHLMNPMPTKSERQKTHLYGGSFVEMIPLNEFGLGTRSRASASSALNVSVSAVARSRPRLSADHHRNDPANSKLHHFSYQRPLHHRGVCSSYPLRWGRHLLGLVGSRYSLLQLFSSHMLCPPMPPMRIWILIPYFNPDFPGQFISAHLVSVLKIRRLLTLYHPPHHPK